MLFKQKHFPEKATVICLKDIPLLKLKPERSFKLAAEGYSVYNRTSTIDFCKIISAKRSSLDVRLGSECTSAQNYQLLITVSQRLKVIKIVINNRFFTSLAIPFLLWWQSSWSHEETVPRNFAKVKRKLLRWGHLPE